MIATHHLPSAAFAELADGNGGRTTVGYLRSAQHSKHLMLLHAVTRAAEEADAAAATKATPAISGTAAFWAGYRLLTEVQARQPELVTRLVSMPHVGVWAHDCLASLAAGRAPDFAYLARVAATAARWAGIPFETDLPPLLSGALQIRAEARGQAWDVLLDATDPHLTRFSQPAAPIAEAAGLQRWRECVQSAWQVLARQKIWELDAFADTVSTIVPLAQRDDGEFVSETTPAAFGAIATMLPADPVAMAETLVHEFQHLKLSALADIALLTLPNGGDVLVYAPWRPDPRPASGLLQGLYAHLAIVRFWDAQRHLEASPDALLRAQVLFARWQPTIAATSDTLLAQEDCLTAAGVQFVRALREQGQRLGYGPVPAHAQDLAEQVSLDHRLTWQLRHMAVDAAGVAAAAAAFLGGGQSPAAQHPPSGGLAAYTRRVDGVARTQLLNLRHLDPGRFRHLRASGLSSLSPADRLLIDGTADEAVLAYRAEILSADVPVPESWVGLATAAAKATSTAPTATAFATRLPLLFEVHRHLAVRGVKSDPMDLAACLA